MALDQWSDNELITKTKMNKMVNAINENTTGVAQGGVKSVNGVYPDAKGNVDTPKTDLSGYATTAKDQTLAGVNNFTGTLQINGQSLDDYIAVQVAKISGGGS